ncbi:MAG: hypothetical protein P1P74_10865 [Desulfuromonadales bacterium]|nr:hypothetical protein [Desulfuromonadales bacterium]
MACLREVFMDSCIILIKKQRFWFEVGLVGIVMLLWLPQMLEVHPLTSLGDEGVIAQSALRIIRGEIPFKDFFTGLAPGESYWIAIFFKIFGVSFITLRLSAFVSMAISLIASVLILKRLKIDSFNSYLLLISFAAFFGGPYWFIASHHWLSLAFCLMSLFLLLKDGHGISCKVQYYFSGVTAGCAAFTLQHKGLLWIFFATVAILYLSQARERVRLYFFWYGVLSFLLPFIIYFSFMVGFYEVFYDLFIYNLLHYNTISAHRGATIFSDLLLNFKNINSFDNFIFTPSAVFKLLIWNVGYVGRVVIHFLPVFSVFLLVKVWRSNFLRENVNTSLLVFFFLAIYLSSFHRIHETTLVYSAVSGLLLLVYLRTLMRKGLFEKAVSTVISFMLVVFFITATGFSMLAFFSQQTSVSTPMGEMHFSYENEARDFREITDFLSERVRLGEQFFAYRYLAFFYFSLNAHNPTPYDILVYPINTQEQLTKAEDLLDENMCRWVLWDYSPLFLTSLGKYIAQNYNIYIKNASFALLERKSE